MLLGFALLLHQSFIGNAITAGVGFELFCMVAARCPFAWRLLGQENGTWVHGRGLARVFVLVCS